MMMMMMTWLVLQYRECHVFSLKRGRTGSMRFPNDESCVMKYPTELALACCNDTKTRVVLSGCQTREECTRKYIHKAIHALNRSDMSNETNY